MRRRSCVMLAVLGASLLAAGCVPVPALESQRSWTAPPITVGPGGSREAGTAVSGGSAQVTGSPASGEATPAPAKVTPGPTRAPTRKPPPTAVPSPTPDRHRVVITEDDVRGSVAAGAAAQGGAQVEGLDVRFTGGKMRITAQQLKYGVVNVRDLVLVGRLFAQDGQLQMAVESVQPGGLVGAFIPPVVNQALAQYASQWYVEDVRTLDGQLELRIR
jgi:hypothetical protein